MVAVSHLVAIVVILAIQITFAHSGRRASEVMITENRTDHGAKTGPYFFPRNKQMHEFLFNLVDEMMMEGKWVNSWTDIPNFAPLYSRPCTNALSYTRGMCQGSAANTGQKRWSWKPNREHYSFGSLNGNSSSICKGSGYKTNSHLPSSVRGSSMAQTSSQLTNSEHKKHILSEQWKWSHSFHKHKFCSLLNGRNILFVGDSLSEETFWVLLSALWSDFVAKRNTTDDVLTEMAKKNYQICDSNCPDSAWSCDGPHRIDCGTGMPSFEISFTSNMFWELNYEDKGVKMLQGSWKNIELRNISLVIGNAGAHYIPDSSLLKNVEESLSYIHEKHPHVEVIWRTTATGHAECDKSLNSDPLKPLDLDAVNANILLKMPSSYHWTDFYRQNMLIKELLKTKFPRVLFLDIYNSTALRSDLHPVIRSDCLHYCMPGPVDDWVIALYNVLGLAQSAIFHGDCQDFSTQTEHLDDELAVPITFAFRKREGSIIKTASNPTCYLVRNHSRHMFKSADEFMSHGFEFSMVQTVGDLSIYEIPPGRPIDMIPPFWGRRH